MAGERGSEASAVKGLPCGEGGGEGKQDDRALHTPKQENVTLRWGQKETVGRGLEGSVWGAV